MLREQPASCCSCRQVALHLQAVLSCVQPRDASCFQLQASGALSSAAFRGREASSVTPAGRLRVKGVLCIALLCSALLWLWLIYVELLLQSFPSLPCLTHSHSTHPPEPRTPVRACAVRGCGHGEPRGRVCCAAPGQGGGDHQPAAGDAAPRGEVSWGLREVFCSRQQQLGVACKLAMSRFR